MPPTQREAAERNLAYVPRKRGDASPPPVAGRRSPSSLAQKPVGRGLEPPPGLRGGGRPVEDDIAMLSPGPGSGIPRLKKGQIAAPYTARRQSSENATGFSGEDLPSPFPPLTGSFDHMDLRESSYELLMGVTGARPSLQRAHLEPAVQEEAPSRWGGKMFGMGRQERPDAAESEAALNPMEVIRRQLEISDFSDQRTRRALTRASASQVSGLPKLS